MMSQNLPELYRGASQETGISGPGRRAWLGRGSGSIEWMGDAAGVFVGRVRERGAVDAAVRAARDGAGGGAAARITIEAGAGTGCGHWLLARRSLHDPQEIAYYACYGPHRSRLVDLAWVAGSRWHIEECFQQAKNEAGLDHYQVRSWRAWYAHITLSMLALAWLSADRAQAAKGEPRPAARS